MTDGNSGTPPSSHELTQQLLEGFTTQIASLLVSLAPHLTDEQALTIAERGAREQMRYIPEEVMPTLINEVDVRKRPTFFVSIRRAGIEGDKGQGAVIKAPKRLDEVHDPGHALQSAMVLALLLAPAARSVLQAYGWELRFGQTDEAPPGKIILSS